MGNLFLQEAFQELNILNEEDFNLGEIDSFKDAKEFNETEDKIDFTDVIDPEAETEDELKDSYIGDVILDCTVCHSKLYKNPEEVHFDEVEGLANTDEECPYCYSTDGYTIIGEVAPYGEKEEEVEETEEEEELEEGIFRKKTNEISPYRIGETVKYRGQFPAKVVELPKDPEAFDYVGIKYNGKRIWTNDVEKIEESLKESIGIEMQKLTPDQIKQLKVGSTKYYNYNGPGGDHTDYSKVKVMKIGKRPIAGHIEVVIRDLQDDHDDRVVNADGLANAIYKSYDSNESLKEGISIQTGMTVKYDVDGNGTPDSCKVVDVKKGTNGQIAYVVLQPPKGDPIRVSADSLVGSNDKPGKKEEPLKEEFDEWDNFYYVVYEIDEDGDEVDQLEGFLDKDAAIAFAKKQSVPTHVVFVPAYDPDDNPEAQEYIDYFAPYDAYEIIWDSFSERADNESFKRIRNRKNESFRRRKGIKEHFEKVEIETEDQRMEMTADDNGKVTVTTNPKTTGEEVIAPVSDEIQSEINPEQDEETTSVEDETDVDISEFSEEDFDNLGESYLKKVYENVNSFKTSSIKTAKNKLVIEGVIGFTSGKNKKTSFVFESKDMDKRGRLRFIGENLQLSRGKKSFTLTGSLDNGKFIAESLNYNYRQKDSNGKSTRVYGTVRK